MKVKVTSDGLVANTRMTNAETGEPIGIVRSLRIRVDMHATLVEALVEFSNVELDITAEALFKNKKPDLGGFNHEELTHPGKANAIPPPPSEHFPQREATTKPTPRPGIYADTGGLRAEPVGPMEYVKEEKT
jgi:hypothetical protein